MSRNRGFVLSYLYTFLNMGIGLFMSAFLLRQLGDVEYGLYQTVTAFANYLVMLEFGMGSVMSRNIAVCRNSNHPERIHKYTSTVWYITLALSIVILFVGVVFCQNIGNVYAATMSTEQVRYGQRIFAVIVFFLMSSFLTTTLNGIILGYENYTFSQKLRLVRLLIRTALLVLLILWKPYGIWIAVVDAGVSVVTFVVTFFYCKRCYRIQMRLRDFDMQVLRESLPLCVAIMIQSIVNQANNSVDKTIIGLMLSLESVAVYSVAQYIYSVFSSVMTIPITMYLPQVAKEIGEGKNGKELAARLIEPCRLVAIVGGMILFGFIAIGRQFIEAVYGSSYMEAWVYALICMIPMYINMTNGALVNVLDVVGKRMARSLVLLVTTVLNIILTVILIKKIGIVGAVVGTAIATVLGQIVCMNIYYSKKIKIPVMFLFFQAYKGVLTTEMVACAVATIAASLITNNVVSLFIGGGIFIVICILGFLKFGFNDSEKQMFKVMSKRIRKNNQETR